MPGQLSLLHMKLLKLRSRRHLRNWLRTERSLLLLRLHHLLFQRILKPQLRVGRSELPHTLSPLSRMTEARNPAMLVSPCLQLLNRVMELVTLFRFCGSSAVFLVTALSLLRCASCFVLIMVLVYPVLTIL